jgi:hypothetical protein
VIQYFYYTLNIFSITNVREANSETFTNCKIPIVVLVPSGQLVSHWFLCKVWLAKLLAIFFIHLPSINDTLKMAVFCVVVPWEPEISLYKLYLTNISVLNMCVYVHAVILTVFTWMWNTVSYSAETAWKISEPKREKDDEELRLLPYLHVYTLHLDFLGKNLEIITRI